MQLAQDCVDARLYAQSSNIEVKTRANTYLAQLEAYRRAIAAMMVSRAREMPKNPRVGSYRQGFGRADIAVSQAGAYLIARDMGLVETNADWTTWRKSLALSDPRFRID